MANVDAHQRKGEYKMPTGKVKWYNRQNGFGFIEPDKGSGDLFVHRMNIICDNLHEGQQVEYDVEQEDKGPVAKNVKPID